MSLLPLEQSKDSGAILNPFVKAVVGRDLDLSGSDVPHINQDVFAKCLELIRDVAAHQTSQAMMVYGDPGAGKTHLLGRLQTWLERLAGQGTESVFVANRMETSASMIWRFLRGNLVEALLNKREDGRLVLQHVFENKRQAILHAERNLSIVLTNLLDGVHVRDSKSWLIGNDLPESALAKLEIAPPSPEIEPESIAKTTITTLCRLGEPVPFVFCLDQLEAIQNHAGDRSGFFRLGKVVSALHDETRNVALISCLQMSLIDDLQEAVRGADADRMLHRKASLQPLSWDQALQLIGTRLEETQHRLAESRGDDLNPIWPLVQKDLQPLFASNGVCVARKVIVQCENLFNAWRNAPQVESRPNEIVLPEIYEKRLSETSPEATEAILRNGLAPILRAKKHELEIPANLGTSAFDGIIKGPRPTALAICDQKAQALAKRFEKIAELWDPKQMPRLLLLRDSRNGISSGAKKSQERLQALEKKGARLLLLHPETLSAIAALNSLLADARSGDLSNRSETIPVANVEAWLANHMPESIGRFADQLAGDPSTAEPVQSGAAIAALIEMLSREKVVSLEEAAMQLGRSPEEVEESARRNPDQFGFAGGGTRVLFHADRSARS